MLAAHPVLRWCVGQALAAWAAFEATEQKQLHGLATVQAHAWECAWDTACKNYIFWAQTAKDSKAAGQKIATIRHTASSRRSWGAKQQTAPSLPCLEQGTHAY